MSLQNKELAFINIKGLYKTTCYKAKSFISFSFLIDFCISAFSLSLSFANFRKIDKISLASFLFAHKNGENLKILIEIFC